MEDVIQCLADTLKQVAQAANAATPSGAGAPVVLGRLEESFTRFGRDESVCVGQPDALLGRGIELAPGEIATFDDFSSRLHLDPLRSATTVQRLQLAFDGTGSGTVELHYLNENRHQIVTEEVFDDTQGAAFCSRAVNLAELPAQGSLKLRLVAGEGGLSANQLCWQTPSPTSRDASSQDHTGVTLVLIRTFGNRDIVATNLASIASYLKHTGEQLADYLFLVYDASGVDGSAQSLQAPGLNVLELNGGNYGGGGNASLLCELAIAAAQKLDEGVLSEVVLWDDDAFVEPESLLRHRSFVQLRREAVVHTALILSKQRPATVQEYGGIWGSYFTPFTHQPALHAGASRRPFPYLVRNGRDLGRNASLLAAGQQVEFGTFIFLSIPMALLQKVEGPVPFFLRNDDMDLCARLLDAGGELCVNQNLLSWHDAAHNFNGEFFASLHGWIVNGSWYELSATEFLAGIIERVQNAFSLGNLPLLTAYFEALTLYTEGPDWFISTEVFGRYLAAMGRIRAEAQSMEQVPVEVQQSLDRQERIETHGLYDGGSVRQDSYREVVFFDRDSDCFFQIQADVATLERSYRDCVALSGDIAGRFEGLQQHWQEAMTGFQRHDFWQRFESSHPNCVEVTQRDTTDPMLALMTSPWQASRVKRATQAGRDHLPMSADVKGNEDEQGEAQETALPIDFEPQRYLLLNPDVKNAGIDPAEHYLSCGIHENRQYR